MKRLTAILFASLLLALAGCSGEEKPSENAAGFGGDLLAQVQQKAAEKEAAAAEWVEVDGDEPFGQYRTVEELRAIIEGSASDSEAVPLTFAQLPEEGSTVQDAAGSQSGDESYAGDSVSVTFSEEGWPEPGVEYHYDWQSQQAAELAAEGYDPSTIIGPDGEIDMEELMRQSREMDEANQPDDPFDEYTADGVMGADDFMDYFENYLGIDIEAFAEATQ